MKGLPLVSLCFLWAGWFPRALWDKTWARTWLALEAHGNLFTVSASTNQTSLAGLTHLVLWLPCSVFKTNRGSEQCLALTAVTVKSTVKSTLS